MSTHATAHGIASLGRYGDTTLVHVAPKEIAGLEALTGRKMTINPHTGMREAFGWSDLLPIVAGVAGTVISGGNPMVGALAAGATKTGVSSAQGNDFGTALQSGLITGATAYAGGSALSGIGEAANVAQAAGSEALTAGATDAAAQGITQGATDAATQGITQGATDAATQTATQGAVDASTQGLGGIAQGGVDAGAAGAPSGIATLPGATPAAPVAAPAPMMGGQPAPVGAGPVMGQGGTATPDVMSGGQPLAAGPVTPDAASYGPQLDPAANVPVQPQVQGPPVPNNVAYANQTFGEKASDIGRGLTDPKILGQYVKDNPLQSAIAAGGVYQTYADATARPASTPAITPVRGPTLAPLNRQAMMPGAGYRPGRDLENRYFASGGIVGADAAGGGGTADLLAYLKSGGASMGPASAPAAQRVAVMPPAGYDPGKQGAWNYFPPPPPGSAPAAAEMPAAAPVVDQTPPDNANGLGAKAGGAIKGKGLAGLKTKDMPSHEDTMGLVGEAQAALSGKHPDPASALSRFGARFGPHAVSGLKRDMARYAAGGDVAPMGAPMMEARAVRGPGGGLDDLVPAQIDGQEPAKLSDGEFVIPADVVSGLGDGSSEAGIKRLHAMMDRIRQHDGGSKKQPGPMPASVMPA